MPTVPVLGLDPRNERCFLPIHVYDTATGRPVAMILRPGKTPSGTEVRGHIRRLVRAIRRHWPATRITIRGDGHYCRPEVMDWCAAHGVDYVFGLTGTKALAARVDEVAEAVRVQRAIEDKDAVRGFAETTHAAKSWTRERRVVARIEATRLGLDIRYVVTNIAIGTAEWLYADLYCARGQAENLIKLHKAQLASDRTSCRAATANQMRLVLHTAAYWLILAVRDAIPKAHALAKAEDTTIRLRLLKSRRVWCMRILGMRPGISVKLKPRESRSSMRRSDDGDQEDLLTAGELALGARTRLFAQRRLQPVFDEALLGPVDGRAAYRPSNAAD
jgi:hypothetical protein